MRVLNIVFKLVVKDKDAHGVGLEVDKEVSLTAAS